MTPSMTVLNLLLFGCTNGVKLCSSFLGSIIYNILTKPGFPTAHRHHIIPNMECQSTYNILPPVSCLVQGEYGNDAVDVSCVLATVWVFQ